MPYPTRTELNQVLIKMFHELKLGPNHFDSYKFITGNNGDAPDDRIVQLQIFRTRHALPEVLNLVESDTSEQRDQHVRAFLSNYKNAVG